jgi:hypothetical protein
MRVRPVARLVPILQYADPIVLEDHFVELGIGDGGIRFVGLQYHGITVP